MERREEGEVREETGAWNYHRYSKNSGDSGVLSLIINTQNHKYCCTLHHRYVSMSVHWYVSNLTDMQGYYYERGLVDVIYVNQLHGLESLMIW